MQRSISGFYPDPEHHWVARLDCHHGQHLRACSRSPKQQRNICK
ncbi:MAG: DUF3565 domain-containing protein [Gammaproteobacteria bacterium]|nr:DUF3565 domain-containing protein [Gammaproteobacteria bacterium]